MRRPLRWRPCRRRRRRQRAQRRWEAEAATEAETEATAEERAAVAERQGATSEARKDGRAVLLKPRTGAPHAQLSHLRKRLQPQDALSTQREA